MAPNQLPPVAQGRLQAISLIAPSLWHSLSQWAAQWAPGSLIDVETVAPGAVHWLGFLPVTVVVLWGNISNGQDRAALVQQLGSLPPDVCLGVAPPGQGVPIVPPLPVGPAAP